MRAIRVCLKKSLSWWCLTKTLITNADTRYFYSYPSHLYHNILTLYTITTFTYGCNSPCIIHNFPPRNLRLKLGAYNAMDPKKVNFFHEITNTSTGTKSYDKSGWSLKTQTQINGYFWTLAIAYRCFLDKQLTLGIFQWISLFAFVDSDFPFYYF